MVGAPAFAVYPIPRSRLGEVDGHFFCERPPGSRILHRVPTYHDRIRETGNGTGIFELLAAIALLTILATALVTRLVLRIVIKVNLVRCRNLPGNSLGNRDQVVIVHRVGLISQILTDQHRWSTARKCDPEWDDILGLDAGMPRSWSQIGAMTPAATAQRNTPQPRPIATWGPSRVRNRRGAIETRPAKTKPKTTLWNSWVIHPTTGLAVP